MALTRRSGARAAREQVERTLDRINWRWSRSLSLLIDAWVFIEEEEPEA
jgi:hypothetical protein